MILPSYDKPSAKAVSNCYVQPSKDCKWAFRGMILSFWHYACYKSHMNCNLNLKSILKGLALATFLGTPMASYAFVAGGASSVQRVASSAHGSAGHKCRCSNRSGGLHAQTHQFQELLQKVAWYKDRDNSLVDSDDPAAKATVVVSTKAGKSLGVQVCPGVFLSTAHGVLNSPQAHKENARPIGGSSNQRVRLYTFPLTNKKHLNDKSLEFKYISPRLNNEKNWKNPETDYVFIKTDPQKAEAHAKTTGFNYSSKNFIQPIDYNEDRLIELSGDETIDVHLYRGYTFYETDKEGFPVRKAEQFDDSRLNSRIKDVKAKYKKPQKVRDRCELAKARDDFGKVYHNCPTEKGTSGSAYASYIGEKQYLIGITAEGRSSVIDSSEGFGWGSDFLKSDQFCKDYQKACGQPCVDLDATLSQQTDTGS